MASGALAAVTADDGGGVSTEAVEEGSCA